MQGRAVLGDVEQSFLEVVLGLRGKNEKPFHWLVDVARWRSSVISRSSPCANRQVSAFDRATNSIPIARGIRRYLAMAGWLAQSI
jgi:hypothetical protein